MIAYQICSHSRHADWKENLVGDQNQEAPLSDTDPIILPVPPGTRRSGTGRTGATDQDVRQYNSTHSRPTVVSFTRTELTQILSVYGRKVAIGEWRDYAIDTLKDRAVFSIFRRTAEMPLYRIEKDPKRAQKQGAYQILAPTGLIIKRGRELRQVLKAIDKEPKLAAVG